MWMNVKPTHKANTKFSTTHQTAHVTSAATSVMRTSRNIFIAISLGWPGKQVAVGRRAAVRWPPIIGWAKGVSAINEGRRVEVNRSTTRPVLSEKVNSCPGKEHEIWRRQNPNTEVAESHNKHRGWRLSSSVSLPNNNSRSNDCMLWRGLPPPPPRGGGGLNFSKPSGVLCFFFPALIPP